MRHKNILILITMLFASAFSSCKKFVDIPPPETSLTSDAVFANDKSATAAVLGLYAKMVEGNNGFTAGTKSITNLTGLSSDELENRRAEDGPTEIFLNAITVNNDYVYSLWADMYKYIYNSTAIISNLNNSVAVSNDLKKNLIGQAKFVRAFCNFYLVNIFGKIPLVKTADYHVNSQLSRMPEEDVFSEIISDLQDAQSKMSEDYSTTDRIIPNSSAATAMLARVYLYRSEWEKAEQESTKIISDSRFALEMEPDNVFKQGSHETIWQLKPSLPGFGTFDGYVYVLTSRPRIATITEGLYNSFEPDDVRKSKWIGIYSGSQDYLFPNKYKIKLVDPTESVDESLIVFRLAEQFLIRSEARAMQNKIDDAKADLNEIRLRAGLSETAANDQSSVLAEIINERRHEFFVEWGHRWFDLKRTGKIDDAMTAIKPEQWQPTDVLYPVPQEEINVNANLLPQNDGY